MSAPHRTRKFHLSLSEDEARMLAALAQAQGLRAADSVRQCIRRESARAGLKPPTPDERGAIRRGAS